MGSNLSHHSVSVHPNGEKKTQVHPPGHGIECVSHKNHIDVWWLVSISEKEKNTSKVIVQRKYRIEYCIDANSED